MRRGYKCPFLLAVTILFSAVVLPAPAAYADEVPPVWITANPLPNSSGTQITANSSSSSAKKPKVYDRATPPQENSDGSVIHTQRAVGPSFCDILYREVVSNHPCWRYAPPSDEEPATPETVDPTRVLHTAVALASVDGAGLVVEPNRGWVYKDVPTLAHATHQQLTTSVNLFGLTIPVQFTATDYTFDFHSGNPPIHTSTPGAPYPDMSILDTYTTETPHTHVTLTTLWDATVTHPTTGDTLTIPAALRTIENSPPFKVIRARQRLISPNAPQPE